MKFVVDTNIAFSAVLNTQSKIGDLILNSQGIFEFYTCDTFRSELKRHRSKLIDLSQLSDEQLDLAIFQITNCLNFTSEALIPFEYWLKGADLVRDTDMDDIAFLALTEFLGVKLWTGDRILLKGLAKKGYTNFITTDELFNLRSLLES